MTIAGYVDVVAADPGIGALRDKMQCVEVAAFTNDYLAPEKRSIGHRRWRDKGMPKLIEKFKINLARRFPAGQQKAIVAKSLDRQKLSALPVQQFLNFLVI